MTVEQLRREVDNHVGPETRLPGFLTIAAWVLSRIYHFGNRRDGWSFDFTKSAFNTQDQYTTGTLAVNQSSTSVTGSGTSWNSITNDRHKLVIANVAYPITTIGGATSITLTEAFAGESVTGEDYAIIQDEITLPAMLNLWRLWAASDDRELIGIPRTLLGDYDVTRNATPGEPTHYSFMGRTAAGLPIIQLFPAPSQIDRFEYWYQADYTRIADIGDSIDLPTAHDALLVQGAIARACQTLRMDTWRDEMENFNTMITEAWFNDRPQRDMVVRMARTDGLDLSRLDLPGWTPVIA